MSGTVPPPPAESENAKSPSDARLPPAVSQGSGEEDDEDSPFLEGVSSETGCPSNPPGAPEIGTLDVPTVGGPPGLELPESKSKPPFVVCERLEGEIASHVARSRNWVVVAVPKSDDEADAFELVELLQFLRNRLEER